MRQTYLFSFLFLFHKMFIYCILLMGMGGGAGQGKDALITAYLTQKAEFSSSCIHGS